MIISRRKHSYLLPNLAGGESLGIIQDTHLTASANEQVSSATPGRFPSPRSTCKSQGTLSGSLWQWQRDCTSLIRRFQSRSQGLSHSTAALAPPRFLQLLLSLSNTELTNGAVSPGVGGTDESQRQATRVPALASRGINLGRVCLCCLTSPADT